MSKTKADLEKQVKALEIEKASLAEQAELHRCRAEGVTNAVLEAIDADGVDDIKLPDANTSGWGWFTWVLGNIPAVRKLITNIVEALRDDCEQAVHPE